MRSRPRVEAASSNLLALHRAVQKPTPTPHGTRARFAAIHQLISSFRVRASDPAGARITSISRTPATRWRRVGGNGGPPLKASPFRLRQALAAHGVATEGACCAARFNGCRHRRPPKKTSSGASSRGTSSANSVLESVSRTRTVAVRAVRAGVLSTHLGDAARSGCW